MYLRASYLENEKSFLKNLKSTIHNLQSFSIRTKNQKNFKKVAFPFKAQLQRENKWLTFGWCVAHRLELALKDSLSGTPFDEIDELILRLYYLYKKSPKKLRQLKELCNLYDETEFSGTGYRPKKASGI